MNNYSSDQPTLPAGQSPYYSQGQGRKPYSFPGAGAQHDQGAASPVYPQHQLQTGQRDVPLYQPTQPASAFGIQQGGKKGRRPRRKRGCMVGCLSSLLIATVLFIFLFVTVQKVLAFGSAISDQSPLSTQTGYMGGSSRVNILIMGYGGSGHDGAYLTDSLVIMSLLPQSHHTTLISVPRDLWVQNPPNSGNYTKINSLYTVASDGKANSLAGGNAVAQKVSLITGLQINYWMTINFAGFKDFVNAIGGVDVNVPDSFTAKYPANDDPEVNPNWITVKFTPGVQHMDGQRAIVYARARYVLDNNAEGSDFARSQRQQLIMKAALTKLKDWRAWPQMYGAMDSLSHTLYSNLSLADLGEFAMKMDLNSAHHVGLSNQNVLVDATSDDGQYILLPRNNDWAQIPTYVQRQLYT
ncbi:MAG TPA: LCP family protein [Ktedonobacteraceae bacterium]|nr:LCP family protein [Ktedonobacteraceae bacterium]